MKQIITVRSNSYYEQTEGSAPFKLNPLMELVIVHTNGKEYTTTKTGGIMGKFKLDEIRLLVSPELLTALITELQLHQKKFDSIKQNAERLTALVAHISSPVKEV